MKLSVKKKILQYLTEHNDGSELATELIRKMEYECIHADCDTHSVEVYDLERYHDQETLKEKLGKNINEAYTIDDCQRVAEAIRDWIADEFSEDLGNAIDYEL